MSNAALLTSLPDRDFRNGFSEAVKVSLLKDPREFAWLCDHADAIRFLSDRPYFDGDRVGIVGHRGNLGEQTVIRIEKSLGQS